MVNWEELQAYLTTSQCSTVRDVRYKANLIKEMLRDRINYFYFAFTTPIVQEFERSMLCFNALMVTHNYFHSHCFFTTTVYTTDYIMRQEIDKPQQMWTLESRF